MSEDIQLVVIVAITLVVLALVVWGCDATRGSEITRRIIATNTVNRVPNE